MSAADHQRASIAEEEVPQRLGHRHIWNWALHKRERFGVVAGDNVAHHDQVGSRIQVGRGEATFGVNLQAAEQ